MDYQSFAELLSSYPLIHENVLTIARDRISQKSWYDDEALTHKGTLKVLRASQKRQRLKNSRTDDETVIVTVLETDDLSPATAARSSDDSLSSVRNSNGLDILVKLQDHLENIAGKVAIIERRSVDITLDVSSLRASVVDSANFGALNFRDSIEEEEVLEIDGDDQPSECKSDSASNAGSNRLSEADATRIHEERQKRIQMDRDELKKRNDEDTAFLKDSDDETGL